MSKLPQDAGFAFEQARARYTPSFERLAHVKARIAHAVETGEGASMDVADAVDVHHALFVPSSQALRRHRFRLPYWMTLGVFAVVLGLKFTGDLWDVSSPVPVPVPVPVQPAQASAAPPSQPRVASAPATPTKLALVPDAALARVAEPWATAAGAHNAGPEPRSRPSRSDKRRRTQTEVSKPASAAPSTPSEDPFGAAFDLPAPSTPPEPHKPPPEPQNEATRFPAAQARALTGSGTAASSGVLAAEVTLIARARKAIARGESARAQLLLRQHRSDFPAGQLLAERVALEVHAHCKAGDAAGAAQALRELTLLAPDSYLLRSAKQKCSE